MGDDDKTPIFSTTYKDRRSGPEPASSDEPGTVSPLISGFGDWLEEHAVLQGYTCYVSVSLSLVVTNPSPEVRCSVGVTPPPVTACRVFALLGGSESVGYVR